MQAAHGVGPASAVTGAEPAACALAAAIAAALTAQGSVDARSREKSLALGIVGAEVVAAAAGLDAEAAPVAGGFCGERPCTVVSAPTKRPLGGSTW